jgi:hypothetical protein
MTFKADKRLREERKFFDAWETRCKHKVDYLLEHMGKDAFYKIAKEALSKLGRINDPTDAVVERWIKIRPKLLSVYLDGLYGEIPVDKYIKGKDNE